MAPFSCISAKNHLPRPRCPQCAACRTWASPHGATLPSHPHPKISTRLLHPIANALRPRVGSIFAQLTRSPTRDFFCRVLQDAVTALRPPFAPTTRKNDAHHAEVLTATTRTITVHVRHLLAELCKKKRSTYESRYRPTQQPCEEREHVLRSRATWPATTARSSLRRGGRRASARTATRAKRPRRRRRRRRARWPHSRRCVRRFSPRARRRDRAPSPRRARSRRLERSDRRRRRRPLQRRRKLRRREDCAGAGSAGAGTRSAARWRAEGAEAIS